MMVKRKVRNRDIAEQKFIEALDRLVDRRKKEGNDVKINMTTIAREAGYARSYLYKAPVDTVIQRMKEVLSPDRRNVSEATALDVMRKLRAERDQMRSERDAAIEYSRVLMLQLMALKGEI